MTLSSEQRRNTLYHEVGHTLRAWQLGYQLFHLKVHHEAAAQTGQIGILSHSSARSARDNALIAMSGLLGSVAGGYEPDLYEVFEAMEVASPEAIKAEMKWAYANQDAIHRIVAQVGDRAHIGGQELEAICARNSQRTRVGKLRAAVFGMSMTVFYCFIAFNIVNVILQVVTTVAALQRGLKFAVPGVLFMPAALYCAMMALRSFKKLRVLRQ